MITSSEQRQLELALEDVRVRVPWNGVSPRALTKASSALFLERKRQKHERFFVDLNQYDLFLAAIPGRLQYGGAPSLLPLPRLRRK